MIGQFVTEFNEVITDNKGKGNDGISTPKLKAIRNLKNPPYSCSATVDAFRSVTGGTVTIGTSLPAPLSATVTSKRNATEINQNGMGDHNGGGEGEGVDDKDEEHSRKCRLLQIDPAEPVASNPDPDALSDIEEKVRKLLRDDLTKSDLSAVSNGLEELVNMLHSSEPQLDEHRRLIEKYDGAQAVLAVMRTHDNQASILACACAFMMHWMHGTDKKVRHQCQAMRQAGCVPVLVGAIHNFPHVAFVQKGALAALSNYVPNVQSGLEDVFEAGGIQVTVTAMAAQPNLGLLQQRACRLLLPFCKAPEYRPVVLECGGLRAFQAALEKHGVRDECVRRYATDAINLLSSPPVPTPFAPRIPSASEDGNL